MSGASAKQAAPGQPQGPAGSFAAEPTRVAGLQRALPKLLCSSRPSGAGSLCTGAQRCSCGGERRWLFRSTLIPVPFSAFVAVARVFGSLNLTTVRLKGVGDSFKKHSDYESKGIKAHFNMDESGVLSLDRVSTTSPGVCSLRNPRPVHVCCR